MCFYNDDCDWIAEVQLETDTWNWTYRPCDDCGKWIALGARCRTIDQIENEDCQLCEDSSSDRYGDLDEDFFVSDRLEPHRCTDIGKHHDYGEEWHGVICSDCIATRKAIHDWEISEGCPEYAAEPNYGILFDQLMEQPEYAVIAVKANPKLRPHLSRALERVKN